MNTREQWLKERNTCIGASETPSILGQGYETAAEVWARKIGASIDVDESDRLEVGLVIQPALIELARRKIGVPFVAEQDWTLRRSADVPYVAASLDAFIADADGDIPLDVKNVDRFMGKAWENEPPLGYQIQLQQQMFVTGATYGYLFALIGGNRPVWHRVERNERFIEAMVAKLAWFWNLIQSREPPPYESPRDQAAVLAMLYPKDCGAAIQLDEVAANIVARHEALSVQAEEAADKALECKNEIKAMLGTATFGQLPDGRWVSWKSQTRKESVVAASTFRVLRFHEKRPKDAPALADERQEPQLEFDETPLLADYVDRVAETESALLGIGAVSRYVSQSGSRYLLLPGGLHVRVADHEPNEKTAEWIDRHSVMSVRVDQDSWREQLEAIAGPVSIHQ